MSLKVRRGAEQLRGISLKDTGFHSMSSSGVFIPTVLKS